LGRTKAAYVRSARLRSDAALGEARAASTTATRELELPPLRECIDVALRLGLVEGVLRLDLCYQVVPVLEGGDLLGAELAPLLLDLAPHSAFRCRLCSFGHIKPPELLYFQA